MLRRFKNTKEKILAGMLAAVMLFPMSLAGCKQSEMWKDAKGKVKVMTTIFPMYDFVRKVGGDHVAVEMMVPAGTEPHAWEPSSKDMRKLEEADLFVYNGCGMELWADDVLKGVANKKLTTLQAAEGIAAEGKQIVADDPHVWLDPMLAAKEMENICDALSKVDPDHAEDYRRNFEAAFSKCEELDAAYKERLASYDGKYIVVAHEAYGYLCSAYGLNQIGIEGVSAESEPDAARMREIIDMVETYGISCIFFEELVSPKVAETIAEETGCKTMALSPLDGISQEEIDAGNDYFSVMYENLDALCDALGGENLG